MDDEFRENTQGAAGGGDEAGSEADAVAGMAAETADRPADEADGDVLAWATEMVRERPMVALLGAVAAGYALAFLLHGGRR